MTENPIQPDVSVEITGESGPEGPSEPRSSGNLVETDLAVETELAFEAEQGETQEPGDADGGDLGRQEEDLVLSINSRQAAISLRDVSFGPDYKGTRNEDLLAGRLLKMARPRLSHIPKLSRLVIDVLVQMQYLHGKKPGGKWNLSFPKSDGTPGVSKVVHGTGNEKLFWDCFAQQLCWVAVSGFTGGGRMQNAVSGKKLKEFVDENLDIYRQAKEILARGECLSACLPAPKQAKALRIHAVQVAEDLDIGWTTTRLARRTTLSTGGFIWLRECIRRTQMRTTTRMTKTWTQPGVAL